MTDQFSTGVNMRIFINYKQNSDQDHKFAKLVEDRLRSEGHQVFRDETNLRPSEQWAKRLEDEVRSCNAMVSVVSNASLRSNWVLNEIDLALKLEKRMLPIIIEDIDESLRFQNFNTRFMSIQWLMNKGNLESLCDEAAAALREIRLDCYRDLVKSKASEYGILDGGEILESLFGVLYQSHWPTVLTNQPQIGDSEQRINGDYARTLVEALRNHVEKIAFIKDQNAANSRKQADEERALRLTWQVQRLKCLSDLLNTLILAWNRNGARKRDSLIAVGEDEAYIFDDSDGEQEFVARDAPAIQGGSRTRPVPTGETTRIVKVYKNPFRET
jgi:hypothetical protein